MRRPVPRFAPALFAPLMLALAAAPASSQDLDGFTKLEEEIAVLRGEIEALRAETVPRGTIAFFANTFCPDGWTERRDLRGRYVVGLTEGGTVGAAVGTALRDEENRATGRHSHGALSVERYRGGDGGRMLARIDADGNFPAGEIDGTNAPYVQLLACERNTRRVIPSDDPTALQPGALDGRFQVPRR